MSFSVSRSAEHQIIEVTVLGSLDQSLRREILYRSADALKYAGYQRLLIDVLDAEFGPEEAMTNALPLVTLLQSLGLDPDTRLAFLYREAEEHRRFFERAAQAEGLHLRYFRTRDEAIDWLCRS